MEEISKMDRYESIRFHNEVMCRLQEAECEAERNEIRYSALDVLSSISAEQTMDKDQAAEKLMHELQQGINSGNAHGWISEDEVDRMTLVDAMSAYLVDPVAYSLGEVCETLDLKETN